MSNDRAFAIFALSLIAIVATLLTSLIHFGITEIPPAGLAFQELFIALSFRGAYKSLDGSNWPLEFLEFLGLIGHDGEVAFDDHTAGAMG